MADRTPDERIAQQADAIQKWLASPDGRACAERLLRRLNLPVQSVDDVLSETWLRVQRTFSRRRQPLKESDGGRTEVRYAQRALESTAIDILRAHIRRERMDREIAVLSAPGSAALVSAEDSAVHSMSTASMIEGCRDASRRIDCRGCRDDVVREVAARVVAALESDPSTDLDDLIYDGLAQVLGVDGDGVRTDSLRARKARCGPCVIQLLRDVAGDLAFRPSGR
jgi:DNA-directed RNA polymerase specialized sigma24 family protein